MGTKVVTIFGILLLTALSSHARLGETLEELEARFGKGRNLSSGCTAVKPPIRAMWRFEKNGILINAYFIDDTCGYISYQVSSSARKSFFSEEEITNLLKVNNDGHRWVPMKEPENVHPRAGTATAKPKTSWKQSGGLAYAMAYRGQLSVISKAYIESIREYDAEAAKAEAEAQKKRLDGF